MDVVIRGLNMLFNCRFAVARAAWIMLGSARSPRAPAFPDLRKGAALAPHFVHNSCYLVNRWSVFWLPEHVAQRSYRLVRRPNAEFPEYTNHSIRRTPYVWKDCETQRLFLRSLLSASVPKTFLKQSIRISTRFQVIKDPFLFTGFKLSMRW